MNRWTLPKCLTFEHQWNKRSGLHREKGLCQSWGRDKFQTVSSLSFFALSRSCISRKQVSTKVACLSVTFLRPLRSTCIQRTQPCTVVWLCTVSWRFWVHASVGMSGVLSCRDPTHEERVWWHSADSSGFIAYCKHSCKLITYVPKECGVIVLK